MFSAIVYRTIPANRSPLRIAVAVAVFLSCSAASLRHVAAILLFVEEFGWHTFR
jgi:hypothetical protein